MADISIFATISPSIAPPKNTAKSVVPLSCHLNCDRFDRPLSRPDRALALGAQSKLDRLTADCHPLGMQIWSADDIHPVLGKADQIAVLNTLAAKGTAVFLLHHRHIF